VTKGADTGEASARFFLFDHVRDHAGPRSDGRRTTYEQAAIELWLERSDTSPETGSSAESGPTGILARVGRALAETLRLNTTLTSLNLTWNRLGEGGGQALQ
jgi:hypothetical protein